MTGQPKDTTGAQAGKGEFVHQDFEESGEERGFGGQCPNHAAPQSGTSLGKEHELRDQACLAA